MPEFEPAHPLAHAAFSDPFPSAAAVRLLVFADQYGASQAIAFVDGLAAARRRGAVAVRLVEEAALAADGDPSHRPALRQAVEAQLAATAPTTIVLSRFGHADACSLILDTARARGIAVVCHIDDDLFGLPASLGVERYQTARHPRRLAALSRAVREADRVIAATPTLAERLVRRAGHGRIGWLENGSAGRPQPRGAARASGQPLVIGYMGSASHGPDLALAAPGINAILARSPGVRFELFGSIARQPSADLLPPDVVRRDVVAGDYAAFKGKLAGLGWDIGLAPLVASAYNRCKTPTKWVEYAEAGVAVIASDMEVYQPMIAAGAAAPARPEQWEAVLDRLVNSPFLREGLVDAADALLRAQFGWERLEADLMGQLSLLGSGRTAA